MARSTSRCREGPRTTSTAWRTGPRPRRGPQRFPRGRHPHGGRAGSAGRRARRRRTTSSEQLQSEHRVRGRSRRGVEFAPDRCERHALQGARGSHRAARQAPAPGVDRDGADRALRSRFPRHRRRARSRGHPVRGRERRLRADELRALHSAGHGRRRRPGRQGAQQLCRDHRRHPRRRRFLAAGPDQSAPGEAQGRRAERPLRAGDQQRLRQGRDEGQAADHADHGQRWGQRPDAAELLRLRRCGHHDGDLAVHQRRKTAARHLPQGVGLPALPRERSRRP